MNFGYTVGRSFAASDSTTPDSPSPTNVSGCFADSASMMKRPPHRLMCMSPVCGLLYVPGLSKGTPSERKASYTTRNSFSESLYSGPTIQYRRCLCCSSSHSLSSSAVKAYGTRDMPPTWLFPARRPAARTLLRARLLATLFCSLCGFHFDRRHISRRKTRAKRVCLSSRLLISSTPGVVLAQVDGCPYQYRRGTKNDADHNQRKGFGERHPSSSRTCAEITRAWIICA